MMNGHPATFVIGSFKAIVTPDGSRPKKDAILGRSPSQIPIADFAVACADQTERDHQLLVEAIESGRVVAETGI